MEKTVLIKRIYGDSIFPKYSTDFAVGVDLHAYIQDHEKYNNILLSPNQRCLIGTGISIELPYNIEAQIRSRSGLAINDGIVVVNSPGTIDPDYRGEIKVGLINLSEEEYYIKHGDRIAQMVFSKFERVKFETSYTLTETKRGIGGFGSTGVSLEC